MSKGKGKTVENNAAGSANLKGLIKPSFNKDDLLPPSTQPQPTSSAAPKVDSPKVRFSSSSNTSDKHAPNEAIIDDLCKVLKQVESRLQKIEQTNEQASIFEKEKASKTNAENEAYRKRCDQDFKHVADIFEALHGKLVALEKKSVVLTERQQKKIDVASSSSSASSSSPPAPRRTLGSGPSNISVSGRARQKNQPSSSVKGKGKGKDAGTSSSAIAPRSSPASRAGLPSSVSDASYTCNLLATLASRDIEGIAAIEAMESRRAARRALQNEVHNTSSTLPEGISQLQQNEGSTTSRTRTSRAASSNNLNFSDVPSGAGLSYHSENAGESSVQSPSFVRSRPGLFARDFARRSQYDFDESLPPLVAAKAESIPSHSNSIQHETIEILNTGRFDIMSVPEEFIYEPERFGIFIEGGGNVPINHGWPPHGTILTVEETGFRFQVDEVNEFFTTNILLFPGTALECLAQVTLMAFNHHRSSERDLRARRIHFTIEYLNGRMNKQDYWNLAGSGSMELNKILVQFMDPEIEGVQRNFLGRLFGNDQNLVLGDERELSAEDLDFEIDLLVADAVAGVNAEMQAYIRRTNSINLRGGLGDRPSPSQTRDESTTCDSYAPSEVLDYMPTYNPSGYTTCSSTSSSSTSSSSDSASSTATYTPSHHILTTQYRDTALAKAYISGRITQEEYWNICGPGFKSGHFLRQALTDTTSHGWESFMAFDFTNNIQEVGLSQEFVDKTLETIAGEVLAFEDETEEEESEDESSIVYFPRGFQMATSLRGGLGEPISSSETGSASILSPTAKSSILDESSEIDELSEMESTTSTERLTLNSMFHKLSHCSQRPQQDIAWSDAATMLHILQDEGESSWPFESWSQAWDVMQVVQRYEGEDTPLSGALSRFLQVREEGGEREEAIKFIVKEDF